LQPAVDTQVASTAPANTGTPMNHVPDAVGIERLVTGCPNVNHLDLEHCSPVTDVGTEWLAAGCPKLNYLNLICCYQVTLGLRGFLRAAAIAR